MTRCDNNFSFLTALLKIFLTVTLISFFTITLLSYLSQHSFHVDEYHFTRKAYYYELLLSGNFSDFRWYEYDAPEQPKLGTYIFGLALHLNGISNFDTYFVETGFLTARLQKNLWWQYLWWRPLLELPPDWTHFQHPILIGRTTSVLFGLATLVVFFLFSLKLKGFLFAWIALFLLGNNPLMHLTSRRAMTDSMLLFFCYVGLLLFFLLIKKSRLKFSQQIIISILVGLSITGAVGVKVVGVILPALLLLVTSFMTLSPPNNQISRKKLVSLALVSFITFSLTFIAIHPYLYSNPPAQFISMFTRRLDVAYLYQMEYPESKISNPREAITKIYQRTLAKGSEFGNFRNRSYSLDLPLTLLGLLLVIKNVFALKAKQQRYAELILLLWSTVVYLGLVVYLKNDWPRYYLPLVTAITLLESYAIAAILTKTATLLKLKWHRPQAHKSV